VCKNEAITVVNPYESPTTRTFEADSRADAAVRSGRVIVICVIAFATGFSLMTIVLFNVVFGSQRLPAQLVRFALTVGLAICIYNGQSWARYVMAVLFAMAVLYSLVVFPAILNNANALELACFVVMMVGYAASAVALIAIPSVGRFMEHQRRPTMHAR
jgi:hypothetical protein